TRSKRDWSSDLCSSDLLCVSAVEIQRTRLHRDAAAVVELGLDGGGAPVRRFAEGAGIVYDRGPRVMDQGLVGLHVEDGPGQVVEIGRASGRESGCTSAW